MIKVVKKSAVLFFVLILILLTPSKYLSSEENKNLITNFAGLNLDALKNGQKDKVIEFLNKYPCSCTCDKKNIAICLKESPECHTSRGLAKLIISSVKAGVSQEEIDDAFRDIEAEKKKYRNSVSANKQEKEKYNVDIGDAPFKGPKDAPVTIIEFSEYQCPFCKVAEPTLEKIMETYKDKIKLVYKHNPLPNHENAFLASEAAVEAARQGKFWEMHKKLYENQQNLKMENLIKYAEEIKLDIESFKKNLNDHKHENYIRDNMKQASSVGAKGTPTFFINGRKLVGAQPFEAFKDVIEDELKRSEAKVLNE